MEWQQIVAKQPSAKPLTYHIKQLKPNAAYRIAVNGKEAQSVRSDANGDIVFSPQTSSVADISINYKN
jgi:hypothetical protein